MGNGFNRKGTNILPKGSVKGVLDRMKTDAIGDPRPRPTILPRLPLSYRRAVEPAFFQKELYGTRTRLHKEE